jgi:hypothetical protein
MTFEGVEASARTIASLRPFHAADAEIGRLSIGDAYEIAMNALNVAQRAQAIWDQPTFVVNKCYFFTVKEKFSHRLAGVLVHAESGDTALVDGSLKVVIQ